MLTRRQILRASLSAMAAVNADSRLTAQQRTLAEQGRRLGLPVGCAVSVRALHDGAYADLVARESTIVVAENAMKWPAVHPEPDRFDFAAADRFVAFARNHSLAMRGHNLCWHEYNPAWLDRTASASNAQQLLTEHITTVTSRYQGQMHSWDVVNEAIKVDDGHPDGLRNSIWLEMLGPQYLEIAFRTAKQADARALLTYNDYAIEYDSPQDTAKRGAVLALLRRLRERSVPVEAVGIQSHLSTRQDASIGAGLRSFLRSVHELGLKVMVTELDVDGSKFSGSEQQRDAAVAEVYRSYLELVLAEPAVCAVLTWGITDRYSWLNQRAAKAHLPAARGLPFDADLEPKAAFAAYSAALGRARSKAT